jgi:hypothetical protein
VRLCLIGETMNMARDVLNKFDEPGDGRRACAVPTRCHTPRRRTFDEVMRGDWTEFVVRYDQTAGRYVTNTACCPGAPICC